MFGNRNAIYARAILLFAAILFLLWAGKAFGLEAKNTTHTTASCTSTTGAALAANEARQAALFINDGTTSIWLRIGEASVANEGILLVANGGSYFMAEVYGNRNTGAVNCITASATVVLLVVEWDNL